MKRRKTISILCVAITLAGQLAPAWLLAQETPRTDPTAAAPGSSLMPPATRSATQPSSATPPSTQPAAAASSATQPSTRPAVAGTPAERYAILRGTDGYWRVGKDQAGAWWFVSPKGVPEFLNTVTTVQPALRGRQRDGADYISRDYNPVAGAGPVEESKELDRWAEATLTRIREVGFKGLGAWSHPVLHKFDVPMTRDLNVWTWLRERTVRFYSPEWAAVAEATIKTQVDPLRENRNLVGYYTDNELDWGDASVGPGVYFDDLAPTDPNRVAVTKVIRQTWPTIEDFNKAWSAKLVDWSDVEGWRTLPREPADAYRKLGSAWLGNLATDYFKITTALVRKHDPNHLVLGVRYRGFIPPEVVAASKGYTDAQSVNYYVSDAALDKNMFQQSYELSGQPLIVTEFSFHSLDGRSGDRNTVGFPAQVLDQQARAEAYKLFTTRTARVPYVIGADWFQWMDEPPSGRRDDGEDVNFGVVDVDDRPYETLAAAIKQTTPLLNALHGQSPADAQADVWREPTGGKPTVKIPYLASAPRLNGELSDWPAAARLAGVKTVRTVGSDRIQTAPPAMLLGWRDEGLYVAFEVFDTHVAAAPADGWWWAKDSIEFWVSTKPPAADQVAYDASCHHFYFVPVDFPNRDGVSGLVGQWYAPGSAIRATLMPHPEARSAVRVLADRYVVEIFLPAKALTGYDPAGGHNVMAFNASVRNFEVAAEYYWSAPKLAVTQARPNTWGTIYLEPKPQSTVPIAGAGDAAGSATGP